MMMRHFLILSTALCLFLGGCAAPKSVRRLASVTAPFVVATHGSVPGVERAFAAQTARTKEELALYDTRRRSAERSVTPIELLWSLRQTAPDKRSVSLLERIRRGDALLRSPPAVPVAPSLRSRGDANVGQITKVTELLKTVGTSNGVELEAAVQFGQETWKQLKVLEGDASAAAEGEAATEGSN